MRLRVKAAKAIELAEEQRARLSVNEDVQKYLELIKRPDTQQELLELAKLPKGEQTEKLGVLFEKHELPTEADSMMLILRCTKTLRKEKQAADKARNVLVVIDGALNKIEHGPSPVPRTRLGIDFLSPTTTLEWVEQIEQKVSRLAHPEQVEQKQPATPHEFDVEMDFSKAIRESLGK